MGDDYRSMTILVTSSHHCMSVGVASAAIVASKTRLLQLCLRLRFSMIVQLRSGTLHGYPSHAHRAAAGHGTEPTRPESAQLIHENEVLLEPLRKPMWIIGSQGHRALTLLTQWRSSPGFAPGRNSRLTPPQFAGLRRSPCTFPPGVPRFRA